jgi:hypothetical protein
MKRWDALPPNFSKKIIKIENEKIQTKITDINPTKPSSPSHGYTHTQDERHNKGLKNNIG